MALVKQQLSIDSVMSIMKMALLFIQSSLNGLSSFGVTASSHVQHVQQQHSYHLSNSN